MIRCSMKPLLYMSWFYFKWPIALSLITWIVAVMFPSVSMIPLRVQALYFRCYYLVHLYSTLHVYSMKKKGDSGCVAIDRLF